jgi:hypothetical protein
VGESSWSAEAILNVRRLPFSGSPGQHPTLNSLPLLSRWRPISNPRLMRRSRRPTQVPGRRTYSPRDRARWSEILESLDTGPAPQEAVAGAGGIAARRLGRVGRPHSAATPALEHVENSSGPRVEHGSRYWLVVALRATRRRGLMRLRFLHGLQRGQLTPENHSKTAL